MHARRGKPPYAVADSERAEIDGPRLEAAAGDQMVKHKRETAHARLD